jgi:hypothetical protein
MKHGSTYFTAQEDDTKFTMKDKSFLYFLSLYTTDTYSFYFLLFFLLSLLTF